MMRVKIKNQNSFDLCINRFILFGFTGHLAGELILGS